MSAEQLLGAVVRVSGFLDRIAYEEGQLVQEGQVLFQLDQKPFLAQLDAARGELKQQQARSWTARASYKRDKAAGRRERGEPM